MGIGANAKAQGTPTTRFPALPRTRSDCLSPLGFALSNLGIGEHCFKSVDCDQSRSPIGLNRPLFMSKCVKNPMISTYPQLSTGGCAQRVFTSCSRGFFAQLTTAEALPRRIGLAAGDSVVQLEEAGNRRFPREAFRVLCGTTAEQVGKQRIVQDRVDGSCVIVRVPAADEET